MPKRKAGCLNAGQQRTSPELPQKKPRLIIGIDPGTTRTVVATALCPAEDTVEPLNVLEIDIRPFRNWTSAYEANSKAGFQQGNYPESALYYRPSEALPVWGLELKTLLKKRSDKADLERYFPLWKMLFHDHMGDFITKQIQESLQRKLDKLGKTKEDLVQDWVASVYNRLIRNQGAKSGMLESVYGMALSNFDIEIVVAVPPGRDVVDHNAIFNAYVQSPIEPHQVFLVAEPEAIFLSWATGESRKRDWKIGDTFIVADGGGGTCCWIRYRLTRLNPPGFVQEFGSRSIVCGSETISVAFRQLAAAKLPADSNDREWRLIQMQRAFDEDQKCTFGSSELKLDYYDDTTGIMFTFEEIETCFQGCLTKLLQGTEHQLQQGNTPTDYLVLGGGLFSNDFIWNEMQLAFQSRSFMIRIEDEKLHVARGAILTRMTSSFVDLIGDVASPLSHAVLTRNPVDQKTRNSPLYKHLCTTTDRDNKQEYYWVMQWLVKKGDVVPREHELASESTFKNARTRGINLTDPDFDFKEILYSIDWHPGNVRSTPVNENGELINDEGHTVGVTFKEETALRWNALELGVHLSNLEYVPKIKNRGSYRILRYSIQMRCENTGTYYWVKVWPGKHKNTSVKLFSQPVRAKPVGPSQNLSSGLSRSRELGSGMSEIVDNTPPPPLQESSNKGASTLSEDHSVNRPPTKPHTPSPLTPRQNNSIFYQPLPQATSPHALRNPAPRPEDKESLYTIFGTPAVPTAQQFRKTDAVKVERASERTPPLKSNSSSA